jgi:lambda family phage portal protein
MRARSMPAPLRASAIVNASGTPYMVPATSHQAADYRSQELGGYNPRYFSTDAAWLPERQKVISRIQDLIRNDGWTSGTLNRYVDQAIGARFSLSYLPNHVALGITFEQAMEFRLQVETAWAQFAYDSRFLVDATERLNFAGLMGLAFRQRMAFGDALGIVNWIPNRPWFASRTALQLVSPERLSNPNGSPDTDKQRGGIDFNGRGAPVRYWFRNRHPGDLFFGQSDNFQWTSADRRTYWGRAIVIHHFEPEEPNQTRGKPGLISAVKKVFMANKFADASLQSAWLNATLAAYLESPLDHESLLDTVRDSSGIDAYQSARGLYNEKNPVTLSGQRIPVLFPGEKIGFTDSNRPNANYAEFEERILRYVASATGQSYEQLAADYSKTNYSSVRAALLESWKFLSARRDHFGAGMATPFFAAWLEDAIDNGTVTLPKGAPDFWASYAAYTQCRWNGPPRGWVDPTKEVEAAIMRMEGGLTTLQDEAQEAGSDWMSTAQQQAFERNYRADLGLPEILPAGATEATDNDEADQAETDSAQGTSNERGNSAHRPGSALARTRALRRKSRIPDCPLAA